MRFFRWLGLLILVFIIVYFLGPRPKNPVYNVILPAIPDNIAVLDSFIEAQEARYNLKEDNEARIVWQHDSIKNKTEYALVYLHGFSASQEEGDPVHTEFAKKFRCNLYLARLDEHGEYGKNPLLEMTAGSLWESAKEAYAIGKQLGEKVILMSTSTGGTLALKLAEQFPEIHSLILLSPNIAINDPNAWLLNNPWGLQIARLVKGGSFMTARDTTAIYKKYWYHRYRMEAVVQLQELLETSMKESVFQKITQPVLLLYYYKDENNQDPVVKVSAMKRMFNQLGTADSLKREAAIPGAGDHVIGSYIKSKDVNAVKLACHNFAKEVLKLKPVE